MAVLEFLSATAGAGVIASGQLVLDDGCLGLTFAGILLCCCLLLRVCELFLGLCGGFALRILRALGLRFGFGLLWSLLQFGNSAPHEDADNTVVHIIDHIVEEFHALEFEDEQGVFLLIRCVLYAVFQVIQLAEVFLPAVVNDVEQNHFLELLHHTLAFALVCFGQVAGDVIEAASVRDGHHDTLKHCALIFIDL